MELARNKPLALSILNMRKRKIVWHTDFCNSKTGYGRFSRDMLSYLYKTGKYEIIEYAIGLNWSDQRTNLVPWKCYGVLPDNQQELAHLVQNGRIDESLQRLIHYGAHNIDKVIKEEKPDIYIGINDPWAFIGYTDKPWWDKINSILHITVDSLPIYPEAINQAQKTKNYLVWAKFAEEEMNKLGLSNVKALPGCINHNSFFRLSNSKRIELRKKNNIPENAFIVGDVARNQLRKSFPNTISGFAKFLRENPESNPYLFLHTNWEEGWRIPDLIKESGLPESRVLTTYICRKCRNYEVKAFAGRDCDCKFCGTKVSPEFINSPYTDQRRTGQTTTNPQCGVTESQLNEIYNLIDVFCHAFSSGGLEIPILEAKLTEIPTLVTNYSCGTETSTEESGGFPLEWSEYREPESQFIKASTNSESIKENLKKVYNLSREERNEIGKIGRDFTVKNYSVESVGKRLEELFDSCSLVEWDFNFKPKDKNPNYPFREDIIDNKEWLKDLYKNILNMDVTDEDEGLKYWDNILKN